MRESSVRHILVRHEQGAGHAAEGYAWATGRVGVCMATSGPGATNLVTALSDAYMDSVPMVAITGQVPKPVIGSDAFQECDTTGITLPVTKHNELVLAPERVAGAIAEAFYIARTGRPGPVLVDVPKDVLQATTEWSWPEVLDLPGYRPTVKPHAKRVREAAALLRQARRPVLYVGGGVVKANAHEALLALAEVANAPVTTTLMARGVFSDNHPLALGMPGMHGNYAAVAALQEADLILALAARFDDRVTGDLKTFARNAKIVHADIDPAEIGKNRAVDVPIVGDVRLVLEELVASYRAMAAEEEPADTSAWLQALDDWKRRFPYRYDQGRDGRLSAVLADPGGQHRADRRQRGADLRGRPAPDVRVAVLPVLASAFVDQLRRRRDHGLRGAGGNGRQGRPAGRAGDRDRRRRLFPDDRAGAGDLHHRAHPHQGADPQQRPPRHGAPVAGAVLRRALLRGEPRLRLAGLRQARRGLRWRRPALRPRRGRRRHPREGDRGGGRAGGGRLPGRRPRGRVPDGPR